MNERYSERQHGGRGKTVLLLTALCLSACGGDKGDGSVTVNLDYTQLMPDGQTCQDGAPRPCFAPLHTTPDFEGVSINRRVIDEQGIAHAAWPFEGYGGQPGDELEVVCQVRGADVRGSDIWDVAVADAANVDADALVAVRQGELNVGHEAREDGTVTEVYFYTPDVWAGNRGIIEELDTCTDTQNPGGYPPVR